MNNFSDNINQLIDEGRREARHHRSHTIKPEHLLMAILKRRDTVADALMEQLNVNKLELTLDCENSLLSNIDPEETDETAQSVTPELDNSSVKIFKLASLEARMKHKKEIGIEHLLLAFLHDVSDNQAKLILQHFDMTYNKVQECLNEAEANTTDDASSNVDTATDMQQDWPFADMQGGAVADPHDEEEKPAPQEQAPAATAQQKQLSKKTPTIDAFSIDLTKRAAEGNMDNVVGREREIQRLQEILCRRKKNNPILIGEPGVGKSAIVEGLAQLIAHNKCSNILYDKRLVALDMAGMVAGTKYRGQFEERIKNLIKELEAHPEIIIFIDEIHTIIGAGGAQGSMDAANMLKPALARGVIQCIGATTLDEYRKTIEKDGALERRFQKIIVEPTTPEETIGILENIKQHYERHHHVAYDAEAITACVKLTQRYVTDRAFPDKAIDAMDEVGAKLHLRHSDVPDDIQRLEEEIAVAKEKKLEAVQQQNYELAANYRDQQLKKEQELADASNKWKNGEGTPLDRVTADDVADVVAAMTGIPVQRMAQSEGERLRNMAGKLKGTVIAQDKAIDTMVKAIQRNRIGLHDPNHPIGVFMFLGPTGVGKTFLAKKLAEEMFGSADALIRIDMSEYAEAYNTSRLVGAPPGYVGYEEGGQLTERVRRKPYSIVLLDEIEKANANVFNMLLQVLDEGRLTDGNGRLVDFRNTIIIMTSNAGTRQLKDFAHGVGFNAANGTGVNMNERDRQYAHSIIEKSLKKQFSPEFLNRLDEIITFEQLDLPAIRRIVDLELKGLYSRVENLGYKLEITDAVKEAVANKGYDVQYGARPLKRAIQNYIEDKVCERILSGEVKLGDTISVTEI